MKRAFACLGIAVPVVLGLACGSGSPTGPIAAAAPTATATTAPTAAPPSSLTIISGETGDPVANAQVLVGGQPYRSNKVGQVSLTASAHVGDPVQIQADGFLDRTTWLGAASGGPYTLWPRTAAVSDFDESFTRTIVYTDSSIGAVPSPGAAPLHRWSPDILSVDVIWLDSGDDPRYLDFGDLEQSAQRQAVDVLNSAEGGRVMYRVPRAGAPGEKSSAVVFLRIFPKDDTCTANPNIWAFAQVSGTRVTSANVTFCDPAAARDLHASAHELGHTFGLRHSANERDMMNAIGYPVVDFTLRERAIMALMLLRRAGNLFPDTDPPLSASAASGPILFIN
jgi:hypothetical protein